MNRTGTWIAGGDAGTPAVENAEYYCMNCGYLLRGLREHRCPECARGFDPHDSTTFIPLPPAARQLRVLDRPAAMVLSLIALLTMSLCLWIYAYPTSAFPPRAFLEPEFTLFAFALPAGLWLLRNTAWFVLRISLRRWHRFLPPLRYRWTLVPALLCTTLLLIVLSIPREIAFRMSLPALNRLLQTAGTAPVGTTLPDQHVGVYWATKLKVIPGGIRFELPGAPCGLFEKVGLLFGSDQREIELRPFKEGWTIWRENTFRLF